MKKAVFFMNGKSQAFQKVYSQRILDRMKTMVDIDSDIMIGTNNLDEYSKLLKEAEVGFSTWGMPQFTEEQIQKYMPNLKAVFYAAGSVQKFARPFLNNGIKVISAWAANAVPVAEFAFAQIVLANKGFFQGAAKTKWEYSEGNKFVQSFPGNYNISVGILGAGMIGTMVIERLKTCNNIDIMVFDPFLSDERAEKLGVSRCSLEEVFENCQTISNHIANNPQTVGMLNYSLFKRMKKNATFINTGRGAQVVEDDLIRALKEEPDRTALLDVTHPEPPKKDSELYKLPNVILTPHMAGSINNEVERMAEYMLDEFQAYEQNKELKYSVSLEMLETMA